MNEALAKCDAFSDEASHLWDHYLQKWTLWNHVRTVAAILATAAFAIGHYV